MADRDLADLREAVEAAELELRLVEALVRIQRGRVEMALWRVANERAIGIDRFAEREEDRASAAAAAS